MSRQGRLAKNTLILSIGTFLPKLAAFVTLPVLTACLTKEEYGTYDLITVLVSLILPAATLQIQTAAFRFLIDARNNKKKIETITTNIFAFIVPVSVAALAVLFLFLPGKTGIRLLICLYFLADVLVNAARQIARGLDKNLDFSVSAIISSFGKMIFAVLFVWYLHMGLAGAVASLFLSSAVSFITLVYRTKLYLYFDISLISRSEILELISYSWPMVPNAMSMWVMRVSDRFVVTLFMGISANAVYAVANKIPSLLTLAQTTFTMAWQENASVASKDEDAGAYYSSMFRVMYDLTAGFLGLLICATPLLFRLFVRGDYSEAYFQMPVLFIGMFFYSQCSFLGGIYVACKKIKSVGITSIAAAICNLVTDIALIKWLGLYAASGSTLISYLLLFVFRTADVKKFTGITYNIRHMLAVLFVLTAECVICFLQKTVLNVVNIALGLIVFVVLNKQLIKTFYSKGMEIIRKHGRSAS